MFDEYVAFNARLRPRAPAVITAQATWGYGRLDADANRLARGFQALGLVPEAGVVSISIGDRYLKLAVAVALARLRITSSPAQDNRADLRLADRPQGGGPRLVLLSPDWLAATLAGDPSPVPPADAPPGRFLRVGLSSGTTREPRRAGYTAAVLESRSRHGLTTYGAGRLGAWIPFTGLDSGMGLNQIVAAWAVGAAVVPDQSVDSLPATLERLQPTLMSLTPTHLRALLRVLPADFVPQPGLRLAVGGGLLPAAMAREARLRLTPDIRVVYGATECGPTAQMDAALLETVPNAVGFTAPGARIDIVGEDGAPLPPGATGQVLVRSDRVVGGYIDDAPATARAFRHGGFMPGDLGRLTPEGLLILDGRADDRMNLGGRKFMPTLMEDVAILCPGVVDCAAFPVPDDHGVDRCWLAVVQGEGFDRERLAAHLAAHRPALPEARFAWTDAIPRNDMGKIDRPRLRADAMAVLGLGAG